MDNVFQMLAQQELDRPRRRLQDLQLQQEEMKLKAAQDEQAYQQKFKTAMAPQPEQPLSLASLGDPTAVNVPNSPMQPKQSTIVDQFKQQYDFHLANGRTDLAQQVMDHQIDLSTKAAKVAEHAYKMGGKEGLAAWIQANPAFAPLLGDPAHMKFDKEGVLFPASDDKGQPVPNMFWYRDAEGKPQFKEVKPTEVSEGTAISDGKGGWTVPVPKEKKPDQEALIDKRFANQSALQEKQIAAADRRAAMQIEAADRRAAKAAAAKETAPGKTLPAGQLSDIADMKRVKDVLAEASNDMSSGKVSTGPVVGRLQSLGSKIGMADDGFVNAQQKLQTAQNIMLKLRSGAAVTESEYARFLKEYPTPNDSPEVFKRKMQNTLDYANTLMDDKMTIYEEGGYKVPQSARSGGKPSAKPAKQPTAAKAPRTASDYLSKFK